ncbi:MAG: hypothetical protein KDA21_02955, partial [Phycisphaerales bacterium]|nr:hypothetical protein [Phycisphaerales bacterium]
MTTGVELWLQPARPVRAGDTQRMSAFLESDGASPALSFSESLSEQRRSRDAEETAEPDEAEARPVDEADEPGEEPTEAGESSAADDAEAEPQIVRRAQERLVGEHETIAERSEAWEVRRTLQFAPAIGLHTAGAASAGVINGEGAAVPVRGDSARTSRSLPDAGGQSDPQVQSTSGGLTSVTPGESSESRQERTALASDETPAPPVGTPRHATPATGAAPGSGADGRESTVPGRAPAEAAASPVKDVVPARQERATRAVEEASRIVGPGGREAADGPRTGKGGAAGGDRVEVSVGAAVAGAVRSGGAGGKQGQAGADREDQERRPAGLRGPDSATTAPEREGHESARPSEPAGVARPGPGVETPVRGEVQVRAPEVDPLPHSRTLEGEGAVALAAARSATRAM